MKSRRLQNLHAPGFVANPDAVIHPEEVSAIGNVAGNIGAVREVMRARADRRTAETHVDAPRADGSLRPAGGYRVQCWVVTRLPVDCPRRARWRL